MTSGRQTKNDVTTEDTSDLQYLQKRLADLTPLALDAWEEALTNPTIDPKLRTTVAEKVLDRRFGKPKESKEISGNLALGLVDLVSEIEIEDEEDS